MKKQVKKLVLAKETVRNLTEEHFTDLVLGGVSAGVASCPCTGLCTGSCVCTDARYAC